METNKDAHQQSSSSINAMETRLKSKYQMESKNHSLNNDPAASTAEKMTLHPQEIKGFSFKKCLSDDNQSSKGSKTQRYEVLDQHVQQQVFKR